MSERTVIVTGATSGLGLECTRALLEKPGIEVILAVRDVDRGEAVVDELGAAERCRVERLDLASLSSVRAFVRRFLDQPPAGPTSIVCNAGLQITSGTAWTEDGIEMAFGVNHLGHFALVTAVVDALAPHSRIVVVSSDTHDPKKHTGMPAPRMGSVETLARPPEKRGRSRRDGRIRYTTSKLCNVLFAYELQRRLNERRPGKGIGAIAFNPGLMPGSGLARDYGPIARFAWRHALSRLPIARTTKESGADLAALASDPAFADAGGLYFDGLEPIRSSLESYDLGRSIELWVTSEALCERSRRGVSRSVD